MSRGLGDVYKRQGRFEKLESKLNVLRDHLEEYGDNGSEAQIEDDSRIPEKDICDKVLLSMSKLQ